MEILQRDRIVISGWNPRKTFDESELEELSKSIEQHGILGPLIVRPVEDHYELVAGERRFRASELAGLDELPVVVKDLTDIEVHEIMLIENLQRSGLQPLEEAQSLEVLLQHSSQVDLAKKLGKSQPWVANRLRLLKAPVDLKHILISRQITPKHVLAILPYVGTPIYSKIIENLVEELEDGSSLSVTQLEHDVIDDALCYNAETHMISTPYQLATFTDWDFDQCEKCDRCFPELVHPGRSANLYCVDHSCYTEKMNASKEALADSSVDSAPEVSRRNMAYVDFDISDCKSCESFDQSGCIQYCSNVECLEAKEKAHREKVQREKDADKADVYSQIDNIFFDDSVDGILRHILKHRLSYSSDSRVCFAFGIDEENVTGDFLKAKVPALIGDMRTTELRDTLLRLLLLDSLHSKVGWNEHLNRDHLTGLYEEIGGITQ